MDPAEYEGGGVAHVEVEVHGREHGEELLHFRQVRGAAEAHVVELHTQAPSRVNAEQWVYCGTDACRLARELARSHEKATLLPHP